MGRRLVPRLSTVGCRQRPRTVDRLTSQVSQLSTLVLRLSTFFPLPNHSALLSSLVTGLTSYPSPPAAFPRVESSLADLLIRSVPTSGEFSAPNVSPASPLRSGVSGIRPLPVPLDLRRPDGEELPGYTGEASSSQVGTSTIELLDD